MLNNLRNVLCFDIPHEKVAASGPFAVAVDPTAVDETDAPSGRRDAADPGHPRSESEPAEAWRGGGIESILNGSPA